MDHRRYLVDSALLEMKRKERIGRDITKLVEGRIAQYVYEQIRGMESLGSMIDLVCSRRDDPYSCAERLLRVLDKGGLAPGNRRHQSATGKGAAHESYQGGSYRYCSQKYR